MFGREDTTQNIQTIIRSYSIGTDRVGRKLPPRPGGDVITALAADDIFTMGVGGYAHFNGVEWTAAPTRLRHARVLPVCSVPMQRK